MGSVAKGVGKLVGGVLDAVGLGYDEPKANYSAADQLIEDKNKNTKKRRALYSTSGGALGQEVFGVDNNRRGNLFGN